MKPNLTKDMINERKKAREINTKVTIKQRLEILIFIYGYLALLKSLEYYELKQDFEICQDILDVISFHSKKYNLEIPNKLTDIAKFNYKCDMLIKYGYDGNVSVSNLDFYAECVIKDLSEIK